MREIRAIIIIVSILSFWIWCGIRIYVSYQQEAHIEYLEAQIKDVIVKHNNVNHKLNNAKKRIIELEDSNIALINVCSDSQFRKASQNTPLPKLKGC